MVTLAATAAANLVVALAATAAANLVTTLEVGVCGAFLVEPNEVHPAHSSLMARG